MPSAKLFLFSVMYIVWVSPFYLAEKKQTNMQLPTLAYLILRVLPTLQFQFSREANKAAVLSQDKDEGLTFQLIGYF